MQVKSHWYRFIISLGLILGAGSVAAQRLIIETPGDGPVVRVIYGRVTEKSVYIFEKEMPLEAVKVGSAGATTRVGDPSTQAQVEATAPRKRPIPRGSVLTSFVIQPDEFASCVSGARYKGFVALVKAMKSRVNQITIEGGSDGDECAAKVEESLKKSFPDFGIEVTSGGSEGIRLQLGVAVAETPTDAVPSEAEAQPLTRDVVYASEEEVAKNSRVLIGEQQVAVDSSGFFVARVEGSTEVLITINIVGRATVQTSVFPLLIGTEPQAAAGAIGYTVRYAQFQKEKLRITISETPFLSKKLTIDGGGGGGFGFGRQVPGERKGQRMTASLGVERRELIGDFGARGSVFYTSAPATVVPSTVTARMMGIYDWSFLDDELVMRFGGGFEIFYAQVAKPKSNATGALQYATIPEQVTAPLVHLSLHTVIFDHVMIAPAYVVTPLYVAGIGYYPSTSPSLEVGMKFKKKWFATFTVGTEEHRYPTVFGETKLSLDYYALSVRRGVL